MKKILLLSFIVFTGAKIIAQPNFSFIYNGTVSSTFLSSWTYSTTTRTDQFGTWIIDIYDDPVSLLEVRCEILNHNNYNATEWVVYFENKGNKNTPIISNIQAANLKLQSNLSGVFNVFYNKGSQIEDSDYQPIVAPISTALTLSPFEGRASAWNCLPFFNVQKPDGSGNIIAIGWAGQWQTTFTKGNDTTGKQLQIIAGMQLTNLTLHPGETIRTPSILSMAYTGDRITSQNQFRSLMLKYYTPTQNGHTITEYPQTISPYNNPINQSLITQTDVVNFVNTLTSYNHPKGGAVWIDAGWYLCSGNWQNTGTWVIDSTRFPGGLSGMSNYIHTNGYNLMLWFEPERIAPNTWLYNNEPNWLLPISSGYTLVANEKLLNLGNSDALNWAENYFSNIIKTNNIDIYRQDFNTNPLTGWQNADSSNRQGITEIKYITGLYQFWDSLRMRNPNLIIDNCSSGGMRYDLELIKRSLTFWRDDDCWKSDVEQCYTYGLSTWFPIGGRGSVTTNPYDWQSGLGAIFSSFPVNNDSTTDKFITANLPEYKSLRSLFTGDFYPLTNYSLSDTVWMAWQFNSPDINQGVIQTFRRQNNLTPTMTFKLKGLNAAYNYSLFNIDTKDSVVVSGINLMNTGIPITLGNERSALIKYSQTQQKVPSYPVTFKIQNEKNLNIQGATILIAGDTLKTNSAGIAQINLSNYSYKYIVTDSGYKSISDSVIVNGDSILLNITLTQVATIKFIIDAKQDTAATIFYLKGSWATGAYDVNWNGGSEQATFYDDGTHSDSVAGDHIFTAQLQLIPDGGKNPWEWGIDDNNHNWINGNFVFYVINNSPQTLTYQMPGANSYALTFVVTDSLNAAIKGAEITIRTSSLLTNPSGTSIFNLINGKYSYMINKIGYRSVTDSVTIFNATKSISILLTTTPLQTVFTFTGNGNWSSASNWVNNVIPPAILPSGSEIDIMPLSGGACILDIPQIILPGSSLIIEQNANLKIIGGLDIQK